MIVEKIKTSGFMGRPHAFELELPKERGLVVLSGPNGSGKSSVLEAVATALWGETLRGETPWRTGEKGEARVFTPELRVARSVTKGGTKSVSTLVSGESEQEWPTAGKAAEFIQSRVGTFDVWRKVSVFTGEDVARFSTASDGDRKRLLEEILGLDRFDQALVACRAELGQQNSELTRLRAEQTVQKTREEARQQRIADAEASLARLRELSFRSGSSDQRADEALVQLATVQAQIKQARDDARKIDQEIATARADLKVAQEAVRLCGAGTCPTCGSDISKKALAAFRKAESDAETAVLAASARSNDSEMARLRQQESQIRDVVADLQAKAQMAARFERDLKAAEQQLERLQAEAGWDLQAEASLDQAVFRIEQEVEILRYAEVVLGLRGVRAQILGGTLRGIEQMANQHLAKIAQESDFRVRLSASTELKSGRTVDALSVTVEGVGGGHGYRACSTGQRRRIDVALVLALARVAEFAHARAGGTLFLDEVFDGLDDYGTGAVVELLAEISAERPVVVVTHNQNLAARIRPMASVVVDFGRVE